MSVCFTAKTPSLKCLVTSSSVVPSGHGMVNTRIYWRLLRLLWILLRLLRMLRSHSCALSVPLSLGFSEIRNACTESTIVGIVWEEEDRQKIIRISRTTIHNFSFQFYLFCFVCHANVLWTWVLDPYGRNPENKTNFTMTSLHFTHFIEDKIKILAISNSFWRLTHSSILWHRLTLAS